MIYSAPCITCGGAHPGPCGAYMRRITRLLIWITTSSLMVVALIPGGHPMTGSIARLSTDSTPSNLGR